MRRSRHLIATAIVCLSLIATPSLAAASTVAPPPPDNAWLALSMLTPSGAAALGETGVAAAQTETPPPPSDYHGSSTPPWPVIAVWVAVLIATIYILTKNDSHHHANSPF